MSADHALCALNSRAYIQYAPMHVFQLASSAAQKSRNKALEGSALISDDACSRRSEDASHLLMNGASMSSEVLASRMAKLRSAEGSKAIGCAKAGERRWLISSARNR